MLTSKIDDKWSVNYDPDNNDRPDSVNRHGELAIVGWEYDNFVTSLFYALLEAKTALAAIQANTKEANNGTD